MLLNKTENAVVFDFSDGEAGWEHIANYELSSLIVVIYSKVVHLCEMHNINTRSMIGPYRNIIIRKCQLS